MFIGDSMREILIIIAILGIIVCASGCTDSTQENKTYSGNGVSFTYPGNWDLLDSTDTQTSVGNMGTVIVVVGVENQDMFGLFTVNIGENQRLATPSEWLSTMKKSIGSNYVSDKTITVDGEKGVQLTAQDSDGNNMYYAFWNKNGEGYMALLVTETESQDLFDSIISTIVTS